MAKERILVKICGLTREEDIKAVNEYGADFAGFVFWPYAKRRYIKPERARELISGLRSDITSVGVFLDEPIDSLVNAAKISGVDMIQLHGSEDSSYIEEVRQRTGKPVIKAFKITSREELASAEESSADMIMLDSGAGTGKVFDWSLIEGCRRGFFLAGGLNNDNVGQAIEVLKPFAVDVSSGVETDGLKDPEKIKSFIETVRI